MKIKKINIIEHPLFSDMEIDFTNKNGEILNTLVLAGSNGSGKTTLLKMLLERLSRKVIEDYAITIDFIFDRMQDKFPEKNSTEDMDYFSKIKSYLDYTKGKIVYMPTEINFQNLKVNNSYAKNNTERFLTINQGIVNNVATFLSKRINTEILKNKKLTVEESTQKVCKEINSIFDIMNIDAKLIGLSDDDTLTPMFKNSYGVDFDINALSSGEKQLFVRAMTLKMLDINNSIVLIDEPEISLHPKWQQKIIKVYENIGKNNQLIIATHSPHIVSSVKAESVKLLKKGENGVEVLQEEDFNGAYGYPVERVLTELMGLDSVRAPEIKHKIKNLQQMARENRYETEEFKELYNEVTGLIGNIDQDIISLDMGIARRKGESNAKNR